MIILRAKHEGETGRKPAGLSGPKWGIKGWQWELWGTKQVSIVTRTRQHVERGPAAAGYRLDQTSGSEWWAGVTRRTRGSQFSLFSPTQTPVWCNYGWGRREAAAFRRLELDGGSNGGAVCPRLLPLCPGLTMFPITIMMAIIPAFAQRQQSPVPAPIFCIRMSRDLISSFSVCIYVPFIIDVSPLSVVSSSKGEFCTLVLTRHFDICAGDFSCFRIDFTTLHVPALDWPIRNVP